ncbi:hypothetical protein J6590_066412 [Homalodisca vitripennis]|nr:hypothetical protein J6590_066412 [Homalodisca vitripennis]
MAVCECEVGRLRHYGVPALHYSRAGMARWPLRLSAQRAILLWNCKCNSDNSAGREGFQISFKSFHPGSLDPGFSLTPSFYSITWRKRVITKSANQFTTELDKLPSATASTITYKAICVRVSLTYALVIDDEEVRSRHHTSFRPHRHPDYKIKCNLDEEVFSLPHQSSVVCVRELGKRTETAEINKEERNGWKRKTGYAMILSAKGDVGRWTDV